jgi:uncharacterized spore protein YtfJ
MVQTKGSTPAFRVLAFGLGIFLGSYLLLVASLEGVTEENKTLLPSPTTPIDQAATLTSILETLQTGYSTRMVLGEPMDVQGIKISPVALIGVGVGEQRGDPRESMSRGGGAIISPVGVILLSSRGVEWLPVQKGLFTQFLEGISSLFLTIWKMRDYATQPPPWVPEKIVSPQKTLLTRLFWTLPDRFRFGFLPVPLGYQLLFLISWLGTVILAGTFFSGFLNRIGYRLSETPLQAGLWGLLSLLLTLLTLLLLTLSIIGIPLMGVIGLLMIGALWLGLSREAKPVPPPPTVPAGTISALSDQIQKVLSANATLGQPIEIKNRTIVPVVSLAFGFGFGSCTGCSKMEAEGAMLNGGGGGWLSPQSLLIITENKVEVMEAKTSMIGEIIKSLTPVITEAIKSRQGRTQPPKEETPQKPPQ